MAELLFVATIIFVAYVVFVAIGDNKPGGGGGKADEPAAPEKSEVTVGEPENVSSPETVAVKAAVKPATASVAEKPAAKPARAKASPAKTATGKASRAKAAASTAPAPAPTAPAVAVDSLKNPKTGEVAKVPGNYAFAKRWIKDALVEEGLLDKVYKNNELDAATTAKIQSAMDQLKAMPKYQ